MKRTARLLGTPQPPSRRLSWPDALVAVGIAVLLYAGVRLAVHAPAVVKGPTISLDPSALPWYAGLSIARMLAAYCLSIVFTLGYGYLAAYHRRAEQLLLPLLDILQSVPILSFLPVVLLSLTAVLPDAIAVELASIVLIFTSQVWNLAFAWYQSLTTIPKELREAGNIFGFNAWLRFKTLELPFAAPALIWNSMMSWAGGWFFLMAAEIFTVGNRDFRLPGLGAYLSVAASRGDLHAVAWGVGTLVLVIVALDQLVWCPLLAWAGRFKLETVGSGEAPQRSWVHAGLRQSRLVAWWLRAAWRPANERIDAWMRKRFPPAPVAMRQRPAARWGQWLWLPPLTALLGFGLYHAAHMLARLPLGQWLGIGAGLLATLVRVVTALALAAAWTLPVGVAIGTHPRLARWLQPAVQILASVPATALFPVVVLAVVNLPGGMHIAATTVMLLGTQWYLLFNIISGASAIPQDLRYTADMMQLGRWERWRTLILPALFPYFVTGAITAAGGAWNASIVAEYTQFAGHTESTVGIGALIAQATAQGDYPLLLAATLSMVLSVVVLNRLIWRRLYRVAADRYRME